MNNELVCIEQKNFGSLSCDIYQNADKNIYITGTAIGTALEYSHPLKAINNIFTRNLDRLLPLSAVFNVKNSLGKIRNVRMYTLRGAMEICRYSQQPKANAFMDFVWDIMESLYKGEIVIAPVRSDIDSQKSEESEILRLLGKVLEEQEDIKYQLSSLSENVSVQSPAKLSNGKNYRTSSVQNTWRAEVYSKIHTIVQNYPDKRISKHDILQKIYEKMNRDYGFVEDQERREYRRRHPKTSGPYITRMDLIEDNGTLSSIFESILDDLLNLSIVHYSEVVKNDQKVEHKAVIVRDTTEDEIDELVRKVAEKIGDTSMKHVYTYRKIYSSMNVRWNMVMTLYAKKHGAAPATRKTMILTSKVVNSEFFRVVNEMLAE